MPAFDIDCENLSRLLTTVLRPRVGSVECRAEEMLEVQLLSVDTGAQVMGRALPRIDVALHLSARLIDGTHVEARWHVESIAGLPNMITKALPVDKLLRKLVESGVERMQWQEATRIEDGFLRIDVHRLPTVVQGLLEYDVLTIPGSSGNALTARARIAEPEPLEDAAPSA